MGFAKRAATAAVTGGASELGNPYVDSATGITPLAAGGDPGASGKGGGGKGSGGPSAPDFTAAANAQTAANRPNQTNAFGAQSQWSQDPSGKWTQQSSLGGPLGDAAKGYEGQLAANAGTPLDNGAQARAKAEQAIYGSEASRLDPRFQQGEEQIRTQLANQGLAPGSEAWNHEMDNFNRAKNDAYQQAQYGAVMGGGQEAQRQQGMDISSRMLPEQQLEGLAGLTGQTNAGGDSQLLPAAIAQYQGALQKYGINQAGKNSTMGGLMDLGGTLGGAYLKYGPK